MDNNLQEELQKAIECSALEVVIEALRNGAKVTENDLNKAEGRFQDLAMEYWDDSAVYAGKNAYDSDEYIIYRIAKGCFSGINVDAVLESIFNPKAPKHKGRIITPKSKTELRGLIKDKNQNLGEIDVSQIKDFSMLFSNLKRKEFNGIESWDTSHVENMSGMFYKFNFKGMQAHHPLYKWLHNLNTTNVTNMAYMFADSEYFVGDLNNWDVSNVENMNFMFYDALGANPMVSAWNVSNVKYMFKMFESSESFNQDISNWNTSNVVCMMDMFAYASSFRQNIDNWNVDSINTNFLAHLDNKGAPYQIKNYPDKKIEEIFHKKTSLTGYEMYNCPTKPVWLKPIEKENGKYRPKNKLQLTLLARDTNIALADIDISAVKDLSHLFAACPRDYSGIETWDTSNVEDMSFIFASTKKNIHDISQWDVSKVKNMATMFYKTEKFNQDISSWDVSKVKDMSYMFAVAKSFNQNISDWNISKVVDMSGMFNGAENFNQDISNWDVSNVESMGDMFQYSPLAKKPPKWYKQDKWFKQNKWLRRSKQ